MRHLLILLLASSSARAIDPHRLADAIYLAEGGPSARRPYGILSVPVRDRAHARQICLRTISTAADEWDGRGDFIAFLARRYCPPQSDPLGHRNWIRNTRFFYRNPR